MPTVPHVEKHFMATETVRDVVIGMADGLIPSLGNCDSLTIPKSVLV